MSNTKKKQVQQEIKAKVQIDKYNTLSFKYFSVELNVQNYNKHFKKIIYIFLSNVVVYSY